MHLMMIKNVLYVIFMYSWFINEDMAFPIQMVANIIKSYNKAISVTAFICYNKHDSANFLKMLSTNNIAGSVLQIGDGTLRYPFPPHHRVFIVDLLCANSWELLFKADKMQLLASPYKWILINNDRMNNISRKLRDLNILVDSEVTIIIKYWDSYVLQKIYKRGRDLSLMHDKVGFWTPHSGFISNKFNAITARQRSNLMGAILKTCLVVTRNESLNHLTDKRDTHIDTITKVNYIIMQHLGDVVNATLRYSVQNTWGYKNNFSQWSGMIGELQRREADVGGTPLFMTSDRVPIIDYIAMTTPTRSKFVFRQPKLSYVTNVYVLPFHWSVWVSSIALIIVTAMGLYGTTKWEWHKKDFIYIENKSNTSELQASWIEILMLAFGAMCQQGSASVPYSYAGRIITISMFIALMFLYTSYSANIVALLQSPSNSIQTLNDLLRSRLDVGVDDTVFNHFYFPNATEPVRRALYLQKVAPPGQEPRFYTMTEGVRKLRNQHFAFHMETGVGYKFVLQTFEEHEKCGLQEIQFLQVPDPWVALQKNTSYKESLKIGFRKIQESGIQAREYFMFYTKKPACTNSGSSFVSVGIVDCYLAAVVLLSGVIISFILFLLEIGCSHSSLFQKLK